MKMWKRAAGALKDSNSIFLASLSSSSWPHNNSAAAVQLRDPAFRTLIIKATSHDRDSIDCKSAHRILSCVRSSPATVNPLLRALSTRISKTRSWPVALKGLLLLHRLFCSSNVPRISRLPFDLSDFHSSGPKSSAYDVFVRSYFAFLDHRSALVSQLTQGEDQSIERDLNNLVKLQNLLDCLLQVRPLERGMRVRIISEAMDCVVIEIFEIYSRICTAIADVLLHVHVASKSEAALALKVIQRAAKQGDDLSEYFHYCHCIGVLIALEGPHMEKILDDNIKDIERIISDDDCRGRTKEKSEEATLVVKDSTTTDDYSRLRTTITDKWEVFEDDIATMEPGTATGNEDYMAEGDQLINF